MAYVDSSIVLLRLLNQDTAFSSTAHWETGVTSELTQVECLRAIDRLRIRQELADDEVADYIQNLQRMLHSISIVRLTPHVLRRASEPHPTSIATLDAIHLSTAYLLRDEIRSDMVFLTHDREQGIGARAVGFRVEGI